MQKLETVKVPFLWGAATSSHQIEGHNENNDWWAWEAQGRIEGGARSGAATDHWHRFREDIRLAAELGLNSYRFSVEWSRVEPEEGRWDASALDWYAELLAECERHQLVPMLTLHHFTSPRWFAEQGGFTSPAAPEKFAAYAKKVVQRLGARVPLWCTLNEPMVLAVGTYLGKFMPPAEFSPALMSVACRHLLKSHALTYDTIRSAVAERSGPWKHHPLQVGVAHNMVDFLPSRSWHPMDRLIACALKRLYNRAWLDALTGKRVRFGVPGLVPGVDPVREAVGRRTIDFIGVNYYTKAYTRWRPRDQADENPAELPFGLSFAHRREAASDLGWAIHPRGLGRILRFASRYKLPLYVTENGIADREDRHRSKYLLDHLREIAVAIGRGIDVRGYFHWSLLDNFEWIKGFGPRFGLYRVNYETFERSLTRSGEVYRKLILAHRSTESREPREELFPK